MKNKKIKIGIVLLLAIIIGISFWMQNIKEKEGFETLNKKNQQITKDTSVSKQDSDTINNKITENVVYKLSDSGCKIGVDSVDGSYFGQTFFKVCSDGNTIGIDEKTCTFSNCPAEKEINTSGWKIYKNSQYGFSIKYPQNWILEETSNSVSFHNKKCTSTTKPDCPADYYGYSLTIYNEGNDYNKFTKDNATENEKIKLSNGMDADFFVLSELNLKNYRNVVDTFMPRMFSTIKNGNHVMVIENDANYYGTGTMGFKGYAYSANYAKEALKTLLFN
ncbi:MAG: hypothetical protein WA055_05085 [Candidatus Moraniibacteriota bacterium]